MKEHRLYNYRTSYATARVTVPAAHVDQPVRIRYSLYVIIRLVVLHCSVNCKPLGAILITHPSLSPTAMAEQTKAAQLKEEGNKLYAQEDYEKAYAKYTEAITEDAANAVLYANRAACSLGMRRQLFLFAKLIAIMTETLVPLVTRRLLMMQKRSISYL